MRESLDELVRQLERDVPELRAAAELEHWAAAQELARKVLSAGSKLHSRLSVLDEIARDAAWVAEVDRAMRKPEARTYPVPLEGDVPLPFAEGSSPEVHHPQRPDKPRRGGKGKPPPPGGR